MMEKCVTIPTERIASDHYLDAIKDHGVMAPLRNDLLRVIARRWHFKAALQRPVSRWRGIRFPLKRQTTSSDNKANKHFIIEGSQVAYSRREPVLHLFESVLLFRTSKTDAILGLRNKQKLISL